MKTESATSGAGSGVNISTHLPIFPMGETFKKECEDAQAQLRTDLLEHLKVKRNDADSSDLDVVCSDGVRVNANKLLLRGRSPEFDSLLNNAVRFTNSSVMEVRLPTVSSAVFHYILDILYAGRSVQHQLVSWQMALEVIGAAHYLSLPNVIKIVRNYLWEEVVQVATIRNSYTQNVSKAASMLAAALKVTCIVHDEDAIFLELVGLLNRWWVHFPWAVSFSEDAVEYILRHTKPDSTVGFLVEEYFRVRAVVKWYVGFLQETKAERLVDRCMPSRRGDLYRVNDVICANMHTSVALLPTWGESPHRNESPKGDESSNRHGSPIRDESGRVKELCEVLSKYGCKDAVARFFKHINWQCVPPTLLVKVISPLQIVPSSQYVETLEYHALRLDQRILMKCHWIHDPSYTTRDRGFTIRKSGTGKGLGLCQLATSSCDDILKLLFSFDIHSMGQHPIHLGLAGVTPGNLSESRDNVAQSSNNVTFFPVMTAHRKILNDTVVIVLQPYGLNEWESPTSVSGVYITFDQMTRVCTASSSTFKQSYSRGIPCVGDIYPAVDLGPLPGPLVRIQLLRGFELSFKLRSAG